MNVIKNLSTSFALLKKFKLPTGKKRRSHKTNGADAGKRTDDNLDNRIDKSADQFKLNSIIEFL